MTGSLDPDLDAALEAARAALRDDPRGHIEYPARLAIRRALAAEGDRAVGAWAFAEMSAADSVLPRWSEWRHRGDNPAQDVVDAARQVLAGDGFSCAAETGRVKPTAAASSARRAV